MKGVANVDIDFIYWQNSNLQHYFVIRSYCHKIIIAIAIWIICFINEFISTIVRIIVIVAIVGDRTDLVIIFIVERGNQPFVTSFNTDCHWWLRLHDALEVPLQRIQEEE